MPNPSAPSEGKGPVSKAEKSGGPADAGTPMEVKQFIYHINPSTNQVVKVEEFNEQTGERKDIPMENYGYGDPYAASYGDPYSYAYPDVGDYTNMGEYYHDPYGA